MFSLMCHAGPRRAGRGHPASPLFRRSRPAFWAGQSFHQLNMPVSGLPLNIGLLVLTWLLCYPLRLWGFCLPELTCSCGRMFSGAVTFVEDDAKADGCGVKEASVGSWRQGK